jgi:adhesin transport system outer membrane protein
MTGFKKRAFMKVTFHPRLSALVIVAAGMALHQPVLAQTLPEVVDHTIKTNPDVMIDVYRKLALDKKVDQAQANYKPKIDLSLGIGRERSENVTTRPGSDTLTRSESGLTLSQMLYDGYATKSQVELAQSQVDSAAYRLADTSQRIALSIAEIYLDVLRRQELLALTQENLATHEKVFQQIKLRADSGIGRKVDLEQASSRFSLAQANLASAEANLRESNIQFQKITGNMPVALENPLAFPCETHAQTIDDAIKLAYQNHPAYKSQIAGYEASLANERVAQAAYKPNIGLDAGTSFNNNLDGINYKNNDAYAMARLKLNVYRGGADAARIKETGFQNDEALSQVEQTKRRVEESTRLSWNALEVAQKRLPILRSRVDATGLTRDGYAKEFNIGQRTLLDLLDTENELYTARSEYINGRYLERFSNYRLMADMGKLLSTLGVAPREESMSASRDIQP